VVSSALLPGAKKIPNTRKAQPGPWILQAVHEMQTAAVAEGDKFHIRYGCNNRYHQDAGITIRS
jgi:hypothetical protein